MQIEEDIITGCINNEKHFQNLLYIKTSALCYAICLRYAANPNDAKDIFQEAFVKVYTQIKNYNKSGSFEGWLKRIFINTSIDYCRRNKKINFVSIKEEFEIEDEEEPKYNDEISTVVLMDLIQNLPDGYRIIFNLYAIEKLTHKEIALKLNIGEGTSKSQLFKARKMLQTKVNQIIKVNQNLRHERF